MAVAISRGALAAVAAIVVCGCGGCGGAEEQVFTAADATELANVGPVAPGWTWPRNPERPGSSGAVTADPTDPLLAALNRRMADLVELRDASNKWRDDDKLANLSVGVFASVDDAGKAIAAANAFSRGWGERSGDVTREEDLDGLGDEAWLLWVGGGGTQVTYHWRRGNLVLEAHVHCFGSCPGDVDAAARAWVDAIDAEARARP